MLPPVRRGAAQNVGRLTVLMAALFGGAGCSNPPLLAPPRRFVRLDALLPLHPSWAQIQSLDREIARLKTAPAQSGSLYFEPHAALPVFVPHVPAPANLAAQRAAQIEKDASVYLKSLTRSLNEANQATLSLEKRREQRRVESAVAARLAEEAKTLRNENDASSFAILQRLRSLTFQDIAIRSRIQDLAQAHSRDTRPLREAQTEHADILAETDRLKAENLALRTQDVVKETARKRAAFNREEDALSKDRLAKRAEELELEKQEKITAAMRLQGDTGIPAPATPELPPLDPRATPLPLPAEAGATLTLARSQVQSALGRQANLWQAQRASLVDEIRADTWKAVQQAALRRGWKLAAASDPGALDGTDEAADDIRTQWRIGKGR